MPSQLERAINLAANTGDKIIVVDELNDRSSVVMNLDEYEKLLNSENKGNTAIENLTEEELLDKINHDIVSWKDANSDKNFLSEIPGFHDSWENEDEDESDDEKSAFPATAEDEDEMIPDLIPEEKTIPEDKEEVEEKKEVPEENLYYYNEPEKTEVIQEESGFTSIKDELKKNKKAWEIPSEAKDKAEEVVEEIPF